MELTENERHLRKLSKQLEELTEAIRKQNRLLNDIIHYPQDLKEPPRLLIGVCGTVNTTDL